MFVQRCHQRCADSTRDPSVPKISIRPLARLVREFDARDGTCLQDVQVSVLNRELNILRHAEMGLDLENHPFNLGAVPNEQRMVRGKGATTPRQ